MQKEKDMNTIFNETKFLESLWAMNRILPTVSAKEYILHSLIDCGYDKEIVYPYLVSLMESTLTDNVSEWSNKEWEKVYAQVANHEAYTTLSEILQEKKLYVKTAYQYRVGLIENAKFLGINPEVMLNEIRIGLYGWDKVFETLILKYDKAMSSVEKVTDEAESKSKKSDSNGDKRGYNLPILQYKKERVYDSIEGASAETGIPCSEIIASMETTPTEKISALWKYADAKRVKIIQYSYLHTYKNLNEVNKTSKEVCGKQIFHSNVASSLKEWSQVYKGEFVWVQLGSKEIETPMHSDYEKTKAEKISLPKLIEESVAVEKKKFSKDLKSLIPYAGGKTRELKYILPAIPESFDRYFEPFIGGGAVGMCIKDKSKYFNDFSKDLVSLYRYIASSDKDFLQYMKQILGVWSMTSKFAQAHGDFFHNLFFSYLDGELKQVEMKEKVRMFCEVNHTAINNVVNTFGFETPILIKSVEEYVIKKVEYLKKHHCRKLDLINKYFLTALQTAVYLNFRFMYNNKELAETNKPLHSAIYQFLKVFAFCSLEKYNKKGEFKVGYGGAVNNNRDLRKYFDYYQSELLLKHLGETQFTNMDFEEFLRETNPTENDFIFLDPPYDCEFSTYSNNPFGYDEHRRLAKYLTEDCNAKWMMVIGKTDFIEDLYKKEGVYIYPYDKKYSVNVKNRNKRDVTHLMITNYPLSGDVIPCGEKRFTFPKVSAPMAMAA